MTVNDRIKSYTDLDKCPKPYKIATLFEETLSDLDKCPKPIKIAARARRRLQALQNSDKAGGTHTHTQQEIADAVGMSVGAVNQRTSVCSDLDKCPKVNKIAFISSISRPIFCRRCKESGREEIA